MCNNLKTWSSQRYGDLDIPSDTLSFDIFAHAAQAVRAPAPTGPAPLGDLVADTVIALGTSQSAGRLATYHDTVHPLQAEPVVDAFFLGEARTTIRTDLAVPVLRLLSEVDVAQGVLLQAEPICNRSGPSEIPKRYAYHAAWDHMVRWVQDGTPPPVAPRIEFRDGQIVRDGLGNARGGIQLSEHAVATA